MRISKTHGRIFKKVAFPLAQSRAKGTAMEKCVTQRTGKTLQQKERRKKRHAAWVAEMGVRLDRLERRIKEEKARNLL